MSTRKTCRLGHYDCISIACRDDRCFSDPSRCTHYANGRRMKRARHLYDDEPMPAFPDLTWRVCSRCGLTSSRDSA